jgi:hypothetical protein
VSQSREKGEQKLWGSLAIAEKMIMFSKKDISLACRPLNGLFPAKVVECLIRALYAVGHFMYSSDNLRNQNTGHKKDLITAE